MSTTTERTNGTPAEQRNPLGSLLKLLSRPGTQSPGIPASPAALLSPFVQRAAQLALLEGPKGNAARAAIRQIITGFQELAALVRDTATKD